MDGGIEGNGKAEKPSDINIIQVINPFVFRMMDVLQLMDKAFKDDMFAPLEDLVPMLQSIALSGNAIIFIAQEDMEWKALLVIIRPSLLSQPQVFHFYCEGSYNLRNALIGKGVEWFKDNGYNGFVTSNTTSQKDAVFKRLFNGAGKSKRLGTLFKFEV